MKEILIDIAKNAGKFLLEKFGDSELSQIAVTKGKFDYSIKMDRMTEDLIVRSLRENGIKGRIIAEESGETLLGASEYTFYIDPLDGTFNYAHGIPHYAVSIGVEKNGEIVMGVIYDPNVNELFFAEKGKGASLNGEKIQVSKTTELGYTVINLFGRTLKKHPELTKSFVNLMRNTYTRMPMSAVLALSYTACGRTDASISRGHNKWDIAAGILLVKEAGGKVTGMDGNDYRLSDKGLVASNGIIHKKILDTMAVK